MIDMKKQFVTSRHEDGTVDKRIKVSGKVFSAREKKKPTPQKVRCKDCPQLITLEEALRKGLTTKDEIQKRLKYISICAGFCIAKSYPVSSKPKICNKFGIKSLEMIV